MAGPGTVRRTATEGSPASTAPISTMRTLTLFPLLVLVAAGACRSTDAPQSTATAAGVPPASFAVAPADPAPAGPATAAPEPKSAADAPSQDASEDVELVKRRRMKRAELVEEYLRRGEEELSRADLEAALVSFSTALTLDPSSEKARELLTRIEAMMGDRYAESADRLTDAAEREIVRRAQARMAAERAATQGDQALREGDYDAAIQHYREAELILRYHPLIATDSLDEKIVRGKLEDAVALQQEARRAEERRRAEQAQARARAREEAAKRRQENKLITLYSEANDAFLAENYKKAEMLCEQILLEDPGNEAAVQLREVAREARHDKTARMFRRDYREQWLRTFEEVTTMDVPQTDPLVFDDLKRWREVMGRQPIEQVSTVEAASAADEQAVLDRLEQARIAPNFGGENGEGTPIVDVAAFLQTATGVNFVVSSTVLEELGEEETLINLQLPERSVRRILDIIADTREALRWKVEDGVVKFVTKAEMLGGQVLKMYEVRDLIQPIPEFPGREINVSVSGGINLPQEDIEEREANVVTSDLLDQLIRNNIAPDSWEEDPANSLRITEKGVMVVNQTPAVHARIAQLLADLREATGIMIDIQSRFLTVEDNFLEDIGVDFRGLGQPGLGTNEFFNDFGDATTQGDLGQEIGQGTDTGGFFDEGPDDFNLRARTENLYDEALGSDQSLDNSGGLSFQWTYLNDLQMELILRAVSKSERVELVSAPRILVSNTGRGNLTVLNQVAYVKDFDVEIAQAASIADPIVDVVQDGVILDVHPVVSADRRFITLELRPTIAQLQRPIAEAVTTLGSQNSVTIQLPELEVQKVRTSIPMPDGSTVLLGGLKVSEKKDLRSGIPILNKIPLVSSVFERKGKSVSNRKLNVLLTANIVIPQEHEPTPAQLGE